MQTQDNAPATAPQAALSVDRKTFWVGVMAVIFAVLLAAHASRPDLTLPTAQAAETVDARDYQLATSLQADGNEALYVLDKGSGLLALVQWNTTTGRPEVVDVKPIQAALGR